MGFLEVKEMITNALYPLIHDGAFEIHQIEYDEKNFGDTYVLLGSNNQIKVRFIKDKGIFWSEIGQDNKWYFIEDVFTYIKVPFISERDDFIVFISGIAELLNENASKVLKAFNQENSKRTHDRIENIAFQRALEMFKQ